ncbi:MAG: phenylalanine--tRNA ligase subunit beta [Verrucomicrobia bacterium]|nr:phenylalanine--tRNA ligase subunit beta [Verrucomicrobiota bacterium]
MKVSLQWLNKYVDLSDVPAEKIADVLPMIGLEVEEISSAGLVPLKNIVIGKILSFVPHTNSDHLSVCQVDVGDGTIRQIVCGAKNFKAGDIVPVALPGAVMPGGFAINETKMRGEVSQGMMCSARELGISEDHAGLLILTERNLPIGTSINDHFPPADTVFDISITANRGDCLSILGVARDLAAYFNKPLNLPAFPQNLAPISSVPAENSLLKKLEITSPNCALYNAFSIRGVKIAPSPEWMQRDLLAVGLRPINNVVDITNWVLMELGNPLHAFDAAKIGGNAICVRQAAEGEKIKLLDGKTYELSPEMCLIADAEKPLVVAGVMGGEESGVTDATTDVVLEAAWFNPANVRKTSRRLALSSDSSMRFTRDVDPTMVAKAGARAAQLICEIAGGEISGPQIALGEFPRGDREIEISGDYVRERCGYAVDDAAILDVFRRLGFSVSENGNAWKVLVPAFRPEVDRPIDLVEEFVRIYGTDTIPSEAIPAPKAPDSDAPAAEFRRKAGALLTGQGFAECVHYTLRDSVELKKCFGEKMTAALALANPLTSDQSHIRPSLLPGLLDAMKLNLAAHNEPRRFFEIGTVFRPQKDGSLREMVSVAFVALAEPVARTWRSREKIDFYFAKKLCLELAARAGIAEQRLLFSAMDAEATPIWQKGHAAAGSDRARAAELSLGLINVKLAQQTWDINENVIAGEILFTQDVFKNAPKRPRFKPFSSFPPVTKDIALIVDASVPAGDVADRLKATATKATAKQFNVEKVNCFDVYTGTGLPEGKKSLAFEIVFRSETKTLTDAEVMKVFEKIMLDIERAVKCTVRR